MNGIQKFYIVLLLFTISVMGLLAVVSTQIENTTIKYALVGVLVIAYVAVTYRYFFRKGASIATMHGLGMGRESFEYYQTLLRQKKPRVLLDATQEFKEARDDILLELGEEELGKASIDEISIRLKKPKKEIKRISKFASLDSNSLKSESKDIFVHAKNNETFIKVLVGLLVVLVVGGGAAAAAS